MISKVKRFNNFWEPPIFAVFPPAFIKASGFVQTTNNPCRGPLNTTQKYGLGGVYRLLQNQDFNSFSS